MGPSIFVYMKYTFGYTSEDESVDAIFCAEITFFGGQNEIASGPSDNWQPGFDPEMDIDAIRYRDNPSKNISAKLENDIRQNLEKNYSKILEWCKDTMSEV
jgi:hypothetical protein